MRKWITNCLSMYRIQRQNKIRLAVVPKHSLYGLTADIVCPACCGWRFLEVRRVCTGISFFNRKLFLFVLFFFSTHICVDKASVGRDQLGSQSGTMAAKHQIEKRDDSPEPQEIREDKTKKGASRETVKVKVKRREDEISENRNRKRGIKAALTVNLA